MTGDCHAVGSLLQGFFPDFEYKFFRIGSGKVFLPRHFLAIEEDHHTVVVLEVQFEMIEWLCSSWTQLSGLHRWNSQIPKLLWKRVLLLTLAKSEAVEAGE